MSACRSKLVGSGFISVENDDPTGEAISLFITSAGIPRQESLMPKVVSRQEDDAVN